MVAKNKVEGGTQPNGDCQEQQISNGNVVVNGQGSNKPSSKTNLPSRSPSNVTLEPNRNDKDNEPDDLAVDIEDICEVVISLKCKQCGFLCNDNATLSQHIKQAHFKSKKGSETSIEPLVGTIKPITGKNGNSKPVNYQSTSSLGKQAKLNGKAAPNSSSATATTIKNNAGTERANEGRNNNGTNIKGGDDTSKHSSFSEDDGGSTAGDDNPMMMENPFEDVFLCAECDLIFSNRELCCSHMSKVHGLKHFSPDYFQDEVSNQTDEDQQQASRKRKTKLPKKYSPESGTIVSKRFRVTKDIIHSCSRCTIKFEKIDVMKLHEKCHVTAISGPSESKTNRKRYGVKRVAGKLKLEEMSISKGFFCPVCENNGKDNFFFPKWAMCAWHLWKEHRIDCELYTCTICKQFKSYYLARVKDHELLHSDKASFKCKVCNKCFKQLKQLRIHEKYHKEYRTKMAPDEDSRWYTPKECPVCKRVLSDSKCLKKHISAVHNKLKPFVCQICGHTSARKAELQLHVRQHTGEKPYKCSICEFQTGDHNSLRKHKLRHGDERPYACPYCDYRCIQSCAFKKHILAIHPGQDVVFLCHLCSHASVNETLFAAHQKEHTAGNACSNDSKNADGNASAEDSVSVKTSSVSGSRSEEESSAKSFSGDEESIDFVDNGGVTIPATPTAAGNSSTGTSSGQTNIPSRNEGTQRETSSPRSQGLVSAATSSVLAATATAPPEMSASQAPEILFEKPNISSDSFTLLNSFVVVKGTNRSGESVLILEPCGKQTTSSTLEETVTRLPDPPPLTNTQIFCETSSMPPVPSPKTIPSTASLNGDSFTGSSSSSSSEFLQNQSQVIRVNEDTESSSEVITNPHQLIQNVQLTPLDLTGVFEQSNDEGMLERLLDMSGV